MPCGCSGTTCSCQIVGGSGVVVNGTGSLANPYVIDALTSSITGLLTVANTASMTMTLSGVGSQASPYVISGVARQAMTELRDVNDPAGPAPGEVPVWVGVVGQVPAHWEFQPPAAAAPGAVTAGVGLAGDGSSGNALRVNTSGTWGTAPLNVYGSDTTLGGVVYTDTTGKVRTRPPGFEPVADGVRPTQYAGRAIIETGTKLTYISDGSTWKGLGTSNIDASQVTSGVLALARIPSLPATQITSGVFAAAQIPALDLSAMGGVLPVAKGGTGSTDAASARAALAITSSNIPSASGANVQADIDYQAYQINNVQYTANQANSLANTANNSAATRALNWNGNAEYVRYAHGPTTNAYNRQAGAGRFAVWMDNGLEFGQAVSSRRYKDEISTWQVDVEALLSVAPATFHRLVDEPGVMDYGAIAEDLDDAGLRELVFYDEQGRPESIPEHRVVWALLAVARSLADRIEVLEGEVADGSHR